MTIAVRDAIPEEWATIKALVAQAALPADDLDESTCTRFKVYLEDNEIKGVIALETCDPRNALLRSLAVRPDARRRGAASLLLRHAEARALSRRIKEIFLLTTTAEGFFSRFSYERMDRERAPVSIKHHEQFRTLCPASAVFMHKEIKS